MNLNWDSLLEPIFLFILSLIAGTLWVIVPTTPNQKKPAAHAVAVSAPPVAKAPLPKPVVEKSEDKQPGKLAEVEKLLTSMASEKESVAAQFQTTDAELRDLQQQNQQLAASLETERQSLESLRGQLRSLQQQQPQSGDTAQPVRLAQQNKEIAAEMEALRKLLAQKASETGKLEAQLAATKARSDGEIPYVPTAEAATKLPVPLELIHNRAVPLNKENFKMQGGILGPVTAVRKSEGETAAEIRDQNSAFGKMLAKIKPDREYLSILLNADSYDIFREVRRIARQKGIDIGWEPYDTSSGKIEMFPVRLTRKAEKLKDNGPRVTPILH